MKDSFYTFFYAAILGVVCALLLACVDRLTGPYKEANARAERILNILSVLQVPVSEQLSPREVLKTFEANVREEKLGTLNTYVYAPQGTNGEIKAVAIGFEGAGLWGPIKGFLALKPGMKIIQGITIYEQEETPGLGGEIAASWFKDQFKGKSIVDASGKPGIHLRQAGEAQAQNEVDAITGATMTCDKLEMMLNTIVEQIVKEHVTYAQ